jgi:hypothetical protein
MLPLKFYTRKRIFRFYTGFSLFIFIWISRLEKNEERLVRHETIHFRQQVEMLFVFHWLSFVFFYLISRSKGHGHYISYRYNPFELEAYEHDADMTYLQTRRPFAWVNYLKMYYATLTKDRPAGILEKEKKQAGW